jgi:hypothetical protein
MAFRLLPLLAALAFIVGCGPAEPPKPTVSAFVASSAAPTVESLATRFEQAQGVRVEVHAGSSATLAKQALSGATMHVFLSADRQWMDELVKAGLVDGADVSDLLANRLVMVAAPETSLDPSRPDALRSLRRFAMGDPASVPVGLGLGRLANFINSELWGRPTDVPWAFVFPLDQMQVPRHPSQLYEAILEGLLLFIAVRFATHRQGALQYAGRASGIFALGYGLSRILVEFFREPDPFLGYFAGFITMGMILSLPLCIVGVWLLLRSRA